MNLRLVLWTKLKKNRLNSISRKDPIEERLAFGGLEFPVAVEVPDGSGRRLSALETVAAFGTFDLDDLVWPSPSPEPPEPERRELSGPAGVMPVPAPNDARPVDTDILAELLA